MKSLNLKTGIKVIILGLSIITLSAFNLKAKANGSNSVVKLVHPKIESSLKLNDELKQKIKNENVDVFFVIDEEGKPKVNHTDGQNQELNLFVKKQFENLAFPELAPNQTYQITINYKVL